jgi:esterase/lipase superfamily enzyme
MGWSGGSWLMVRVLRATLPHIPVDKQKQAVSEVIVAFEDLDADTLDECVDEFPVVGEALRELYPHRYDSSGKPL